MRYEWDGRKDRENWRKHRISFEDAALVFDDERCLVYPDRADESGEQRWHAIGTVRIGSEGKAVLLVVHAYRGTTMAKKSSASSQPVKLVSMSSEDIRNRKRTEKEREALLRIAERQAAGDDSGIDFSDIPPLTDEQLAGMVRLRDFRRKVPVSVRLDPKVLEWLKSKGEGHLTRINDILMNLMEAEHGTGGR